MQLWSCFSLKLYCTVVNGKLHLQSVIAWKRWQIQSTPPMESIGCVCCISLEQLTFMVTTCDSKTKLTWLLTKHFLNVRFTFVEAIVSNIWRFVPFLEVPFSSSCSWKYIWIRMTHVFSVTASSFSCFSSAIFSISFPGPRTLSQFGARPFRYERSRAVFTPIAWTLQSSASFSNFLTFLENSSVVSIDFRTRIPLQLIHSRVS